MRVVQPRPLGGLDRGIQVAVVVHSLGKVLEEVGPEVRDVASVLHEEGDVLQGAEPARVDAGMPSQDQSIHTLARGPGEPSRGGAVAHGARIEVTTVAQGSRVQRAGDLVSGTHGSRMRSAPLKDGHARSTDAPPPLDMYGMTHYYN